MNIDPLAALLKRLEQSEVALPEDLIGCTSAEIEALEAKCGQRLPKVYRRFLQTMGRHAGWLFVADQVLVDYATVLSLTEELRESLGQSDPELAGHIPPDALFILTDGNDLDFFLCCGDGDDPPVYALNKPQRSIEQAYGSVLEWLEDSCQTAEDTIADGWFEDMGIARHDESSPPRPRPQVEPLPFALLCPGCARRIVFPEPSTEHSRWIDLGFLYDDAGTSTLVWSTLDPAYQQMFGEERPWNLSPEQQAEFEARLRSAPSGGRWRFANQPRCPHCRAAVSLPMTEGDLCLVYDGSLVLEEHGPGRGLCEALLDPVATRVQAPGVSGPAGRRVLSCPTCATRVTFDLPTTDHARLKGLAFLYNDAGNSSLVWAVTDPASHELCGNQKPWELSPAQQAAFEARLKPAPTGGAWRFANPARCPGCGGVLSPAMIESDLCLVFSGSRLLQHWISGSSLRGTLKS